MKVSFFLRNRVCSVAVPSRYRYRTVSLPFVSHRFLLLQYIFYFYSYGTEMVRYGNGTVLSKNRNFHCIDIEEKCLPSCDSRTPVHNFWVETELTHLGRWRITYYCEFEFYFILENIAKVEYIW